MTKNTAIVIVSVLVIGTVIYFYTDLKKGTAKVVDSAIDAGKKVVEATGEKLEENKEVASKLANMGENGPVTNFVSNLWDGVKYLFTGEMDGVKIKDYQ